MTLKRIDSPYGRFYETPNGSLYPSVTTVLASIPNAALDQWRNAVGEEEANRVSKLASSRGTRMHTFCEDYLKGRNPKLDIFDRQSYKGLSTHLDQIEYIAIEEMLYSDQLRVAGTLDCLGKYKGKMCIIDFKSTSTLKHEGEFDSYWLQTAAYSMMVYERMGLVVPDLLILMQNLQAGETYVYHQKSSIWLPKFKQIRDAYQDQSALLS
jgi:genome maintenance exonuclease 1